jgi:hypothetical protein
LFLKLLKCSDLTLFILQSLSNKPISYFLFYPFAFFLLSSSVFCIPVSLPRYKDNEKLKSFNAELKDQCEAATGSCPTMSSKTGGKVGGKAAGETRKPLVDQTNSSS